MSAAAAATREELEATGANGDDKVKHTGMKQAQAFAALAKAYLEGKRRPLTCERSQELVSPYATQPDLMLHNLARGGFISRDGARGKDRTTIVNVDLTVFGKEGRGKKPETRCWPLHEGGDPVEAHAPVPVKQPKPKQVKKAVDPTEPVSVKSLALLRVLHAEFHDGEFKGGNAAAIAGMNDSTFYDRLRQLVLAGAVGVTGGTPNKKSDPQRYRITGKAVTARDGTSYDPVTDQPLRKPEPKPAPPARTIKTKAELEAEVAAIESQIREANVPYGNWLADCARLDREASELEAAAAVKRAEHARVVAENRTEPDTSDLEQHKLKIEMFIKDYDLLYK